jgi:hypothetical protein
MWCRLLSILGYSDAFYLIALLSLTIALVDAGKLLMLNLACRDWSRSPAHSYGQTNIHNETAYLAGGDEQWLSFMGLIVALPSACVSNRVSKYKFLIWVTVSHIVKIATFCLICRSFVGDTRLVWFVNLFDLVGANRNFIYVRLWSLLAEVAPPQVKYVRHHLFSLTIC